MFDVLPPAVTWVWTMQESGVLHKLVRGSQRIPSADPAHLTGGHGTAQCIGDLPKVARLIVRMGWNPSSWANSYFPDSPGRLRDA